MSEEVLEGLKGVELVNSGYHGSVETTAVLYDPAIIGLDQIMNALKDTGIYLVKSSKWRTQPRGNGESVSNREEPGVCETLYIF